MKILHSLVLLSLTSSLLLASPQDKQAQEMKNIIKIGKESSGLLGKTLGSKMKEHMKKGGPMEALNFCSTEAYTLTESVNKKLHKGVKVKRITSKPRSSINTPTSNEQTILDSLQSLQKSGVVLPEYLVEKVDENSFKYYKPLLIDNGACLKCHGNLKDEKMKKAIAERYPLDKALGYEMNDLRGAIVVTIDKQSL